VGDRVPVSSLVEAAPTTADGEADDMAAVVLRFVPVSFNTVVAQAKE
jgi:hypothetical protein